MEAEKHPKIQNVQLFIKHENQPDLLKNGDVLIKKFVNTYSLYVQFVIY